MEELIQKNLHPVIQEIQRWQNIIGHRFTADTWQNYDERSSDSLAVTALRIGEFVIRVQLPALNYRHSL